MTHNSLILFLIPGKALQSLPFSRTRSYMLRFPGLYHLNHFLGPFKQNSYQLLTPHFQLQKTSNVDLPGPTFHPFRLYTGNCSLYCIMILRSPICILLHVWIASVLDPSSLTLLYLYHCHSHLYTVNLWK